MTAKTRPARVTRAVALLLALLMTTLLTAAHALLQADALLHDRALHASVATDERVTALQRERIDARIDELAAVYGFAPKTLRDVITTDALHAYNLEVVDWWTGLLGDDAEPEAPTWPTAELTKAVRSDEGFQATVPSDMRTTVARDDIAYGIASTVERIVLPVRTSLTNVGLPMVYERVDVARLAALLPLAGWLLLGAAAVLLPVMLLLLHRRPTLALEYTGAALIAAALVTALLMAVVALADVPGQAGAVSAVLGLQLQLLGEKLAWRLIGMLAAAVVAGALLMLPARLRRNSA